MFLIQKEQDGLSGARGSLELRSSVADPHHCDADPDPAFHFDAETDPDTTFHYDPDPTFQNDAEPDPVPTTHSL